jgi:hypothetical protein
MKLIRSSIRVHGTLGSLAVVHAASVLCIFLLLWYGHDSPEWAPTLCVALAILWIFWPIVLALHRGRSWMRFTLPLILSLVLLSFCLRVYTDWAPDLLGLTPEPRMPTPDNPIVERTQDLGGGFRQVMLAEFITGGFESIYHGEYLYFRDYQLGDSVSSSVAPSQRLAAFVKSDLESPIRDDHFGFHVFVFRTSDQKSIQLTQELRYDWAGFEWDEKGGYLVLLHRHDPPERLALPQA